MKTVKMSLANLEGKLSRKEMKGIMAGSGSGGGKCADSCMGDTYCGSSCPNCHFGQYSEVGQCIK